MQSVALSKASHLIELLNVEVKLILNTVISLKKQSPIGFEELRGRNLQKLLDRDWKIEREMRFLVKIA